MKKSISLVLTLVVLLTSLFGVKMSAYAGEYSTHAKAIKFGTTYSDEADPGVFGYDDYFIKEYRFDSYGRIVYKISVPAKGKVTVTTTNSVGWSAIYIYKGDTCYKSTDGKGQTVSDKKTTDSSGRCRRTTAFSLTSGTYYVVIRPVEMYAYCTTKVTYSASVTSTSLSKVIAKDNAFKAVWYTRKYVSGYQIQYSTKSSMSNAKAVKISGKNSSSKTVKSLKNKKKYYVRVRTYRTVKVNGSNKTYYSKWSSKKTVTTK